MAAAQAAHTPFAAEGQEQDLVNLPDVVDTVDEGKPTAYKVVRSATGKQYVEAEEYDPLEHHRSKDRSANKGDGLGFMCCCFKPRVSEPGIDRMYSMGDLKSADTSDDKVADAKTADS